MAVPSLPRVLLAEDYAPNIVVATVFLKHLGYACVAVRNGAAAVARAAEGGFAVAVMDIELEGLDGVEATRRIRAAESEAGSARLPILGVTGHGTAADRARFLAAGMDDVLTKPYGPDALREKLAALVGAAK